MKPTIGRKVYYWPSQEELEHTGWNAPYEDCGQPYDATVIFVHDDGTVNLNVVGWVGDNFLAPRVEQTTPEAKEEGKWSWMPYQIQQAAKQDDQK